MTTMEPIIPDTNAEARIAALEHFLQRYLGLRLPEFGTPAHDLQSIEMPDPLLRFFKFAGREATGYCAMHGSQP